MLMVIICLPARFPIPKIASQLAGAIRHSMPRMRDREVPYGTKGGEHNGHKEESCEEDEKGSEEKVSHRLWGVVL